MSNRRVSAQDGRQLRVRLRRGSQVVFLLAFLWLAVQTVWPLGSLVPVEMAFRLDPLLAGSSAVAARELPLHFWWALPLLAATLLVGRFVCGWVCPLGTVLDATRPRGKSDRVAVSVPDGLTNTKYVLLETIVVAALLGNLTLLFLDPITIFLRALATFFLPALNLGVTAAEFPLYQSGLARGPVLWVESTLRGGLLPYEQSYYPQGWAILGLFLAVVGGSLLAPRLWCRYLCPLGALFDLLSRTGLFHRRVTDDCIQCGACLRACRAGKMDAIADGDFSTKSGECIQCTSCAAVCPTDAIKFAPKAAAPAYSPSRRQALAGLGAGALGVAALRLGQAPDDPNPALVRPPGAQRADFLARCVRCGQCVKVCPTGTLQPALFEAGLKGFWSPRLDTRLGYCDYSCNACGQVCPTGAIQQLLLEDKRKAIIGTAYIDENRCIPFADGEDCIVCEEMCPIPDKAIKLREKMRTNAKGEQRLVKLPMVVRRDCIGCGICEYQCPLPGEAAIRVRNDVVSARSGEGAPKRRRAG